MYAIAKIKDGEFFYLKQVEGFMLTYSNIVDEAITFVNQDIAFGFHLAMKGILHEDDVQLTQIPDVRNTGK